MILKEFEQKKSRHGIFFFKDRAALGGHRRVDL